MISFKQYLEEAKKNVAIEWKSTPLTPKQAAKMLVNNCDGALTAFLKKGRYLCRGFKGGKTGPAFIDTTKSLRASRDYSNTYQLAHDASEQTKHIPSRSNSLICTTDPSSAKSYGGDSMHLVFPFDGYPIAIGPNDDFVYSEITSPLFYGEVNDLDRFLHHLIEPYLKPSGGKYWDVDEIDAALSSFSNEEFMWYFILARGLYDDELLYNFYPAGEWKKYDAEFLRAMQVLSDSLKKFNIDRFSLLIDAIKDGNVKIKPYMVQMMQILRGLPRNKRFTAISSEIFNKKSHPTQVIYDASKIPNHEVECWFSGKSVVIPVKRDYEVGGDKFRVELAAELKKLGVKADKFVNL